MLRVGLGGSVPPNAVLLFEMEVVDVMRPCLGQVIYGFLMMEWKVQLHFKCMVWLLLLCCASVNSCRFSGETVEQRLSLKEAIQTENFKMFKKCLEDKNNRNLILKKEQDGTTLLHWACAADKNENKKEAKIVKELLKLGSDIRAQGPNGWTPLHFAVYCKYKAAVELLLAEGADPNSLDKHGISPLLLAYKTENKEIISLFHSRGAA